MNEELKNIVETPDTTAEYDAADIEKNKVLALVGYIWILFLVPLLVAKTPNLQDSMQTRVWCCSLLTSLQASFLRSLAGSR